MATASESANNVPEPAGTVSASQKFRPGMLRDLKNYRHDANSIKEDARRLLEKYAGIAPEEVNGHVERMVSFIINPFMSNHYLTLLARGCI